MTPEVENHGPEAPRPYGKPPLFEGGEALGSPGGGGLERQSLKKGTMLSLDHYTLIYKKRQSAREWKCCMWGTHLGEFPCSIHFFETSCFGKKCVMRRNCGNYF